MGKVMGVKMMYTVIKEELQDTLDDMDKWDFGVMILEISATLVAICVTGPVAVAAKVFLMGLSIWGIISAYVELSDCLFLTCDPDDKEGLNCDVSNPCHPENLICNEETRFQWKCERRDVICYEGFTCDPTGGVCKINDQQIPCVAVIDEDDGFGYGSEQEKAWADFRNLYPNRPFCLLIPNPESKIAMPDNFRNDDRAIWAGGVTRDGGDPNMAMNWFNMCGLNLYKDTDVKFVGLFIDDSGSMKEYQVAASRDLFVNKLKAEGIEVKKVVNSAENWIEPFMTTLVDEPGCIVGGVPGKCIDVTECNSQDNKLSVPWDMNEPYPEPSCRRYEVGKECCITPPECVVDEDGTGGKCLNEETCEDAGGIGLQPWKEGDPEPKCRAFPMSSIQCCIMSFHW